MPIDDPIDAFGQQYMKDEPTLPNKLAKYATEAGLKLAFPDGGLALQILLKVAGNLFDPESGQERVKEMFELMKGEFEHVETTKASHDDVQKAIQLAIWYDRHERDDAKRARYVALIGNALQSDEQIQDVTSYIQTIEQLNERDLIALKVLNVVMNKDGDWRVPPMAGNSVGKVHPNIFIQRATELSVEVAKALGQSIDGLYSREVGYGMCNRLQGFGLAHEINSSPRELPHSTYCFRLSVHGIRLLKLLGEDVPNYTLYWPATPKTR